MDLTNVKIFITDLRDVAAEAGKTAFVVLAYTGATIGSLSVVIGAIRQTFF